MLYAVRIRDSFIVPNGHFVLFSPYFSLTRVSLSSIFFYPFLCYFQFLYSFVSVSASSIIRIVRRECLRNGLIEI